MADVSKCPVCQTKGTLKCGGCDKIAYCSKEHQRAHWGLHKSKCCPYKIVTDPKLGRYLVAARNISAGEIILTEEPLVVGPKQDTIPICLACYSPFEPGHDYRCPSCTFPMCGEKCAQNASHAQECAILSQAKQRPTVDLNETRALCPAYECITPLRCALLAKTDTQKYEKLTNLQSHMEERKKLVLWQTNQINIVEFLNKACSLNCDDETLHNLCGILDTNTFEIKCKRIGIRGVYFTASMMAHSCISNVHHAMNGRNFHITLRACTDIPKGEALWASYTHSFEGTIVRRANLRHSKFFDCDCPRCADPTECGTHFSSLRCLECKTGVVSPLEPLKDIETDWACDNCEYKTTGEKVSELINKLQLEFDSIDANNVRRMESFIEKHSRKLHPNHFLLTQLRFSLSQLYGRDAHWLLNNLSPSLLRRKVGLCEQVLRMAAAFEPGMSRLRGVTLYELHAPLFLLARNDFEEDAIDRDELLNQLQQVRKYLAEAEAILRFEGIDGHAPEATMARAAQTSLRQLDRWINTI